MTIDEQIKEVEGTSRTIRLPYGLDRRVADFADSVDRSVSWVFRTAVDNFVTTAEEKLEKENSEPSIDDPYFFHHGNGHSYRIPQPGEVWFYTDSMNLFSKKEVLKWRVDILAVVNSKYARNTYVVIDAAPGPKLIPLFPHQLWEQSKHDIV